MTGITLGAFLLLLTSAPLLAGDALTQSLEHPTSRGTVAEKDAATPPPAPSPPTMTDKEADKKISFDGRPSKAGRRRRRPVPVASPTPR